MHQIATSHCLYRQPQHEHALEHQIQEPLTNTKNHEHGMFHVKHSMTS